MRVLVFGDSITQGFWDLRGGWVGRLRAHYDSMQIKDLNADFPTVFNLGISAETSAGVVKRIENEADARVGSGHEQLWVVAIGINNSCVGEAGPWSTDESYKGDLDDILKISQNRKTKLLFVGLTPVDDDLCNPVSWGYYIYQNERVLIFENILKNFCIENNLAYINLFDDFQKENKNRDLLADGLHPNDAGHEFIFKIVLDKIQNTLSL